VGKDESVTRYYSIINYASHFSELTYLANQFVDRGPTSNGAYQLASESMRETIKKDLLLTLNDGGESEEQLEGNGSWKSGEQLTGNNERMEPTPIIIYEPLQDRKKGRPKENRLKPVRELPKSRGRKCNRCGQRGVNHDKRNCPFILDR